MAGSTQVNLLAGVKRTATGSVIKKPPFESMAWCYTSCKEDTSFGFAWTIEGFRHKMEQYSNGQSLISNVFK